MRFKFCQQCGKELSLREIGDEGLVPYCNSCERPWFDMFSTCVICLLWADKNKFALLKQNYLSRGHHVCVSGYVTPGETAEQAAAREVKEEIGLDAERVDYLGSWFYDKRDQLMLGFAVKIPQEKFSLSCEVDDAEWFDLEGAKKATQGAAICQKLIDAFEQKI
ncbi:MAG: NUDIX domain-containing protein [Oscillospiraceae bacterium]|nr:NUDIX domain-containing protein [Oscillospiraceae bacterium]